MDGPSLISTRPIRCPPPAARLAAAFVGGMAAAGGASAAMEEWHIVSDESRRATFFKYEKRLRECSEVDKVFDYFSTVKDGKHKYMTESDLMRSVVNVYPVREEPARMTSARRALLTCDPSLPWGSGHGCQNWFPGRRRGD